MTRSTFTTHDSVELAGRRWLHERPSVAVVLVHGFAASADDPLVVAVAETLHTRGFEVVSYDSRGHGRSSGESTLGDLERHDVAAAVALGAGALRDRGSRGSVDGCDCSASSCCER